MDSVEVSARSVEEAVQRALEQMGLTRDQVDVTVLKEGRSGILGIGSEEAKVRVERLVPSASSNAGPGPASVDKVRNILETLLAMMGVEATVEAREETPAGDEQTAPPLILNIKGDDVGILIGRHGQTLSCLQFMVGLIFSRQSSVRQPIMVDAEGYRQRRYESLQAMAARAAERVKLRRVAFTMRPMSAAERRVIHLALTDDPDVTTESTGEGDSRRVVIMPRKKGGPPVYR